ncbi:uncharacterized protein TRIADDRAFT_61040 [Trichoplax adhaerens]|uniref:G-protein coupled receptors family 2 profile 2 domain-containing protein n=1 Tax=Trichoplax adhaerens TaxID=10228 RepID=B3S9V5_TRIAD|nr:predicted protein [Trichoplax adhaerens]EDV20541.1 predicted protein [Trichoplax adhaerens]|eukprot:XP_002116967.1 predicted protein [Trichoplax adhaerens]
MAIILASKNFTNAKSENLEKGQEEFSIYKHYLIRAFFLLLLIAVGWTLFVLFIIYNHIILQYAFAILSFLQGLYVFVFYGIQKIILKNDDWEKSSVKTMDTGRGDSFTSRRKTGPPEPDSINVYEDTDVNNVAYEEIETPPSSMEDSVRF